MCMQAANAKVTHDKESIAAVLAYARILELLRGGLEQDYGQEALQVGCWVVYL